MTVPVKQNAYLASYGTGTIFPTVIFARPPSTSDFNFPITQRWIDTSGGNAEWFLLKFTSSLGVVSPDWVKLASGSLSNESLTGNTGGAVFPDGSFNINIVGDSSGIQFAGNPGTHTLTGTLANIPNSSLLNSSITLVGGTDITITGSPVSLGGSATIGLTNNTITLTAGTGITITGSPVALGGTATISTTDTALAFDKIAVQVFTGSGTYTPTAGMKYCTIEVVGGGGGSGGNGSTSSTQFASSGAGGGGGYARKTVTAATIGVSQTVTIGAGGLAGTAGANAGGNGGTTSVGAIVSATGGSGGAGGIAASTGGSVGGVGGVGSSGDFNINGSAGGNGFWTFTGGIGFGAQGGSSFFGGSALAQFNNNPAVAGLAYGGGAGSFTNGQSAANQPGAAGAAGIVVITEFVAA